MKHESAMTEWPFEKGLAMSQFLTSFDLEASPSHPDEAWGERGSVGWAVTY